MDGKDIQAWRERHGWTQGQLAEALGVNRVTVADWERGAHGRKILATRLVERALLHIEHELASDPGDAADVTRLPER